MPALPAAAVLANVDMDIQIGRPKHSMPCLSDPVVVSRFDQVIPVGRLILDVVDTHLDVDDGLGRQTDDRSGADVVDAPGLRSERSVDTGSVLLELVRPGRVVSLDDDDPLLWAADELDGHDRCCHERCSVVDHWP